jgi:hypothetical protein
MSIGRFRVSSRARTPLLGFAIALGVLGAQLAMPGSARAGLSYAGMMHAVGSFGLHGPRGVAADDHGNVFVVDTGGNRVVEFDSAGDGVRSFGLGDNAHIGQDGHLYNPQQVVWSPINGHLYVTDAGANEVQEFTATGGFVRKWGSQGFGDGQFSLPVGITVDCAGNVYVTNAQNPWDVEEFSSTGTFVKRFGAGHAGVPTGIAVTSYSATGCTQPDAIVSDEYDGDLTMYDSSGNYLRTIGTFGHGHLQFDHPEELSARTDGAGTHVWIGDSGVPRAQEITTHNGGTTWAYTAQLTRGAEGHPFSDTTGVWVDTKGRILVANVETTEIDEFKNAAPALTFRQVHNTRKHVRSSKGLDFTVRYNQLSQSCRLVVSAKVTVPPHATHVFTVKKTVSVRDSTVDVTLPLSTQRRGWLRSAWAKGHKVAVAATAKGCTNNTVRVSEHVKFSI